MECAEVPTWLSLLGYCHRQFRIARFVKKILLRSGIYDLNRFVGAHHYIATITIRPGILITLHLDDHIDNIIWWNGYYEKNPTRLFLDLLNPDDIVIDVGANIGYYSILAASRIGRGGKVYAFEPVSSIYRRLLANVGSFNAIQAQREACGNTTGKINMYVADDTCSSGSRISQPIEGHELKRIEEVSMVRLDDAISEKTGVSVMKIDVEGYEPHVLAGASELIRSNPQIKIFIEVDDSLLRGAGSSPEKVFAQMAEFGLQPWRIIEKNNAYILEPHRNYWNNENLVLFARAEYLPRNLLGI